MHIFCVLLLALLSALPAEAGCACQGTQSLPELGQAEAQEAQRLPSEADRRLAREFRNKGLPIDAEQYYRSAAMKADGEANQVALLAKNGGASAASIQQTALHSAGVLKEAASFFQQLGKLSDAASNWEAAINAELTARKARDLTAEYGTLARLYEAAGNKARAAEMYRRQIDVLSASKGRYSAEANFARAELKRLSPRLSYTN